MFSFLCKRLLPKWRVVGDSANTPRGFVLTKILPTKSFSSSSKSVKDDLQQSFTVSYFINSCGLPLKTAISLSQKVNFESPERPNSVLPLLRDHGFTDTQITKIIRSLPRLLRANPEESLLPKFEFFSSIGFPSTDLTKFLTLCPFVLTNNLENQVIPWYNFLKSLLVEDKYVVNAFKRLYWSNSNDVQRNFAPNISVLRELGVPESLILSMVKCYSFVLGQCRDKFDKIVKEVIEMGYNPKKREFASALLVFSGTSKSTREHKMEVFRRWGWAEDDVRILFKKCPLSMLSSEEKIRCAMDFLVNKMGYQIAAIARCPLALRYSLEKRVIPRCTVIKVLLMKDLIKQDLTLGYFLHSTEKHFKDKFVTKYLEDVPRLLDVYQGKMSLLELGFGSEEICGMKPL